MARLDGKTLPGTGRMSTGSEQGKVMTMSEAKVLDPASGGRMMYFDKTDRRVLFGDIRDESWELCDGRRFDVHPDRRMDYRELPFPDGTYRLVVFDPPLSQVLACTPHKPLFGNRQPKQTGTHWIVWVKEDGA